MIKFKIGINSKMILLILSITISIYAISMAYMMISLKRISMRDAQKIADTYAREYANLAGSNFNVDMDISRALSQAYLGYKNLQPEQRLTFYNEILKNVLERNQNFLSTWLIWEIGAIDPTYTKPHGRARFTYYRNQQQDIVYKAEILDTIDYNPDGAYYKMRQSKQETIMDPYYFSYTGKESDQIMETSVCVPILDNGKFVGLAGVDVALGR